MSTNKGGSHKSNSDKRRRKGKLRYDRVISVGVLFLVLIVMLVSCIKGCSDNESSVESPESSRSESEVVEDSEVAESSGEESSSEPATENTDSTSLKLEYSDVNKGDLILVNKTYEYKFDEELDIIDIYSHRNDYYSVSYNNIMLESNVLNQLNAMMEAYYKATENTDIRVIEAYRQKEGGQDTKVTDSRNNIYSEYNTARTFELGSFPKNGSSYYLLDEGVYSWIYENCKNYGFILRYPVSKDLITGMPSSTYTFRYVGVPHAIYISQNNLTLEEYIESIKAYTKDKPLKVTDGTKNYDIYYVQANVENTTEVIVPSGGAYTISGNNVDGFIVTVTLN